MDAERVLTIAQTELGKTESPAGSNKTLYGKWYGLDGQPWCMMFVMWVFHTAGLLELLPAKTASCGTLMRAAKAAGCWVTTGLRPGDVVIYDFPGGAATDHCGIVESVTNTGIVAIEGNTSVSGSQSNGGMVCRKPRPNSQIVGAVRPRYQEEEMIDISKLTDVEVLQLWSRIQSALVNQPLSDKLLGEWAEAKAKGITDGNNPNSPATRAQTAAMILRATKMQHKNG